jgi:hypothetical protein
LLAPRAVLAAPLQVVLTAKLLVARIAARRARSRGFMPRAASRGGRTVFFRTISNDLKVSVEVFAEGLTKAARTFT